MILQNHRDSTDPTLRGSFRDARAHRAKLRFPHESNGGLYHGLGLKAGLYSRPVLGRARSPAVAARATGRRAIRCVGLGLFKYDLCTYHDVVPAANCYAPAQQPYR